MLIASLAAGTYWQLEGTMKKLCEGWRGGREEGAGWRGRRVQEGEGGCGVGGKVWDGEGGWGWKEGGGVGRKGEGEGGCGVGGKEGGGKKREVNKCHD